MRQSDGSRGYYCDGLQIYGVTLSHILILTSIRSFWFMFLKLKNWIILSKLSAIIIFLIFKEKFYHISICQTEGNRKIKNDSFHMWSSFLLHLAIQQTGPTRCRRLFRGDAPPAQPGCEKEESWGWGLRTNTITEYQVLWELHEMLRSPVENPPGPSDHLFITIYPSPASLPCKKNSNSSESALKKVESLMARWLKPSIDLYTDLAQEFVLPWARKMFLLKAGDLM